jgi:uncharacterized protein YbbC (DUF1343 family)
MINFNPINQIKQFHVGVLYAMHPTCFAFRLYNYYFSIKMDIPHVDFNQIKHSQSFHKNGLEFIINLIIMPLVKKPCFYIMLLPNYLIFAPKNT